LLFPTLKARDYFWRGFRPLLTLHILEKQSRKFRRGVAPLKNYLPLPLDKGKGIKGIGLIN